jgi:hypothetical protein
MLILKVLVECICGVREVVVSLTIIVIIKLKLSSHQQKYVISKGARKELPYCGFC